MLRWRGWRKDEFKPQFEKSFRIMVKALSNVDEKPSKAFDEFCKEMQKLDTIVDENFERDLNDEC